MTGLFLILALFACLAIGMPIAIALGLASLTTLLLFSDQSLLSVAQQFFTSLQIYPLLALPFFILAGNFMATGGVARRMIDFANALVGHLRGGLAMAALLASAFFAAVSGSSPATVAAVGGTMVAGMEKSGYTRSFAAGLICNAGTLGILIPPSIVMVVYGAVTETSIGALFVAGILPGVLLTAALMVAVLVIAKLRNMPRQPRVGAGDLARASRRALWGLLLIGIVLGGIYLGVFTPTEAAAVSAIYAFVVTRFVYRDLGWADIPKVIIDSAKTSSMLMFIIANAYVFAFVLTTEQIPQTVADWIVNLGLSPWAFLLVLNVLLLVAGNFMDPNSVILILAPILFPIATALGIDAVHLGIIMVVNMEIGLITPPVGLNLFVTAGVAKMPVEAVVKAAVPWLGVLLLVLLIVTYVPWISLVLPRFADL